MKIGLVINHSRMGVCFAGAELRILADDTVFEKAAVVHTYGWEPLEWGRRLAEQNVELLLCAGIDLSTWAAVRGNGICVIPNLMGDARTVFETWRKGELENIKAWPPYPHFAAGAGRRRRLRRGHRSGRG